MERGIKINMLDGSVDNFDPVSEFTDNNFSLKFWVGGYHYYISKKDVKDYSFYDLCEECKHELTEGKCSQYSCSRSEK